MKTYEPILGAESMDEYVLRSIKKIIDLNVGNGAVAYQIFIDEKDRSLNFNTTKGSFKLR